MKTIRKKKKPLFIGITGGPGVGKTAVSELLAGQGIAVISADKIGHEILQHNRLIQRKLRLMFGDSAFDSEGQPIRKTIGAIVFANPEKLITFNALVHPMLLRIVKKEMNRLAKAGRHYIAVDAALIYEWGIADWFDIMVVVDAKRDNRILRMAKCGLSRAQIAKRIGSQMPQKDKTALADIVIDNNGGLPQLKTKIDKLVKIIEKFRANQ